MPQIQIDEIEGRSKLNDYAHPINAQYQVEERIQWLT